MRSKYGICWVQSLHCYMQYHVTLNREPMLLQIVLLYISQIAKFMGPTWGPPGTCRPQLGPMLAPWTLLLGISWKFIPLIMSCSQLWYNNSVTGSFINHWYGYYGMMYSINYAMFKSTTYQLYAKIDNLRDVIICFCLKTHKTSGVYE